VKKVLPVFLITVPKKNKCPKMTQNMLMARIPFNDSMARFGTSVEKTALAFLANEKHNNTCRMRDSKKKR